MVKVGLDVYLCASERVSLNFGAKTMKQYPKKSTRKSIFSTKWKIPCFVIVCNAAGPIKEDSKC